jgi:hypothetical protein
MSKLIFVYKKEELIEIYKDACRVFKVPFNPNDFLKNYPQQDINPISWIERWKINEKDIIADIEKVYRPFPEGDIIIGLFPKKDIFWQFSYFQKTYISGYTFGCFNINKASIILFPNISTIQGKIFSFRVLIHELFHANDMLYQEFGWMKDEGKHKWYDEQAWKIVKKYFKYIPPPSNS